MDKRLLDKIEIIFLIDNLLITQNAIVAGVIRKMHIIEDAWGCKPLLLVCNYNIELQRMNVMLRFDSQRPEQAPFGGSSRILGVYNHFQRSYAPEAEETEYSRKLSDGESSVQKNNIYEIYKNNRHIRTEHYTGLFGRLRMVERLDGGKPVRRVFYDDAGCISMIQRIDKDNPEFHPEESYYTTGKQLCITAEYSYDPNGRDKNIIRKLTLFKEGRVFKECASNAELAACCLDDICGDPAKLYLIVDETGKLSPAPLAVTRRNVFRCAAVHGVFLTNVYRLSSPPHKYYAHLCEHRNEFDGIIFPAISERTDFIKKYPGFNPRKATVIPHPYAYPVRRADFEARDHKKAVIITRYEEVKQIPHAISVFELVVRKVPNAVLEIYGFGQPAAEEKIDDRIRALGLGNNVRKMGYAGYPIEILRSASAFLMTGVFEGTPLSLVESICNGCPVFAYDIKYGPADAVIDRVTGFLVKRGDGASLAARLIEYFQDINLQRRMSDNCYKDADRFGVSRFLDKWGAFMENLYNRRRELMAKEISDENIAASET